MLQTAKEFWEATSLSVIQTYRNPPRLNLRMWTNKLEAKFRLSRVEDGIIPFLKDGFRKQA